ncbi:acyltransferase [Kineococcus radiotolerans]|uniref:Acyltransferase 3 n=1 Tax=Kineococcus radiotolerans (strain ATCC BAA-149 / DSM 14245 / SRS30216) TaxID=266940 RepID=A6W7Z9_KINRD|nr:acyltransferase [Kineococcus radiotolerans]ABS02938.1 acyltransferase 3 [Kineococcus radiotolerans SRS30216 = ATCC BAA-149]
MDTTPPGAPAPSTARPPRRHLHEIDVVRLATFTAVIALHSLGSVAEAEVGTGAVLQLLHFGRETFFVVTGFVLVLTGLGKDLRANTATLRFWRKRFALVGLPYAVWTVVYWATRLSGASPWSGQSLGNLLSDLVHGTARYHLYFLQISMQVYLVLPLLLWFVRRTREHHLAVLVVSAALQVVWFVLLRHVPAPGGWAQNLWTSPNQLLLTYQFYLLLGAVAAYRYDRVTAWVRARPRAVALVVGAALLLDLGVYAVQVAVGVDPLVAAEPLQPVFVLWGPAACLGLLALGLHHARRRRPGPVATTVGEAARISFGVYLAHPLVLTGTLDLLGLAHGASGLPVALAVVIAWVCTTLGSAALVELLSRTPVAVAFTGRPRVARARPPERVGAGS